MKSETLAVIETHPIQYHAPVYRVLQQQFGVPVTAIYGSDFSVKGYRDKEFGVTFAWDTDLLGGYTSRFLSESSLSLAAHLREVAPAAVLVVGYSPRFHRDAFFQAWRGGYPILFRAETTDHARSRSSLKSWSRDRALQWYYSRCARLLYIGEQSRAHYRRLGCAEEKLIFAPYCVDTTPFACDAASRQRLRAETRAQLGIPAEQRVALFVGKLSTRKGPDLLLQALPPGWAAIFVGDGELRAELARQAGQRAIHFVGFQNQTQLSRYYHAADVFALPSVASETWGLVVNEALHHGVPVVVSDAVGCAPDLVVPGKTGEVCATGSVMALQAALLRAVAVPGALAQCQAHIAGYTVEKAAAGIAQALADVVQREPVACSV